MYRHINASWQRVWKEKAGGITKRLIEWRRNPTIMRLERPTRLDRARMLGYKAKQGFVVVRVKVGRGGMRKSRPRAGRRPKHLGVVKIKGAVNIKDVVERRAVKKFPNLTALNSYLVYQDGKHAWHEVIMVDSNHPAVTSDYDVAKALGLARKN